MTDDPKMTTNEHKMCVWLCSH